MTLFLSTRYPAGLSGFINDSKIIVPKYSSANITLNIIDKVNGNQTMQIVGRDISSNVAFIKNITVICSDEGVDLSPSTIRVIANGDNAGTISIPMNLTNYGMENETFRIKVTAPNNFIPSINDPAWNYTTNSMIISIEPNESKHLLLIPRLVGLVKGMYDLNVSITSISNDSICLTGTYLFVYTPTGFLVVPYTSKMVTLQSTVNYSIGIRNSPAKFGLELSGIEKGWHAVLSDPATDSVILDGNGFANYSAPGQNANLVLTVDSNNNNVSSSNITITAIDWGSTPSFGIAGFIVGTVLTTGLAVIIAAPVGVLIAIFLAGYCPKRSEE